MATGVALTATDTIKLYEDKIQRLQADTSHAWQEGQSALLTRDQLAQDVATLQREKDRLIEECEAARQEATRITRMLAEHRQNVEASLAAQEATAREAIDHATAITAAQTEREAMGRARQGRVEAVRQALLQALAETEQRMHQTVEALRQQIVEA